MLSVVIAVYNEEERIRKCLEAISWVDEIIIVDGESQDKTVEICKEFTDKIYIRKNQKNININKEFGFGKTVNEWILYWDADEIMTEELKVEILEKISTVPRENGFFINRINYYYGKRAHYAQPDFQLRLFRKGKARYKQAHVHSYLQVDGETGYLQSSFHHFTMATLTVHLEKINFYSDSESIFEYNERHRRINIYNSFWFLILKPILIFLRAFFLKKAYRDGVLGIILSVQSSYSYFIKMAKCWEYQKNGESSSQE